MMKTSIIICPILVLILRLGVEGHSYHYGACPKILPEPNVNFNKLLGVWYVIQKTNTAGSCIFSNISAAAEPEKYLLETNSQHPGSVVKHYHHSTATIVIPDEAVPGRIEIKSSWSVTSEAYTIFMTDYDHYLAMYTCQNLMGYFNRESVTILSRERTLDLAVTEKIRSKLSTFNIDPFQLSVISQKDCPTEGIISRSTKKVAGVIKNIGEKVGDGYNYVANGATNILQAVANSSESDDENVTEIHI